jgi:hypothetical protein
MNIKKVLNAKTAEEARSLAIEYQSWASNRAMSYGELNEWTGYFTALAKKFHLTEEFKENGII